METGDSQKNSPPPEFCWGYTPYGIYVKEHTSAFKKEFFPKKKYTSPHTIPYYHTKSVP